MQPPEPFAKGVVAGGALGAAALGWCWRHQDWSPVRYTSPTVLTFGARTFQKFFDERRVALSHRRGIYTWTARAQDLGPYHS